jgi:phage terminase large subunit
MALEIVDDFRPIIENIFDYKYRYFAYLTGRLGLGKSSNISKALLVCGLMKPLRIVCAREVMSSIKDSVHAQLSDIIREYNLPYAIYNDTIRAENGTTFIFKGLRETGIHNIRSMTNINICWLEEAQSVSKSSWESLAPTIRAENSFIIVSANPDQESDVVYQLFGPDEPRREDVYYCYRDYRDNPFPLPEAVMADIEAMRKNRPDAYEMIYLGKLRKSSDFPVVKEWSEDNIGIGNMSQKIYWSLDFNVNPQCSVVCHWRGDHEFYFSDEIVLENASTYQVAE